MENENEASNPTACIAGRVSILPLESQIQEKKDSLNKIDERAKRISILKNVIIISFAFMLNFTSFNAMSNLQSSVNKQLGITSLWVIYVSFVLSCAFVSSWMIKNLNAKWTLSICMFCYSTYIAAQFYPTYYTLIPSALLVGIGAAPMWSAKCTYMTKVGEIYGSLVGEKNEVIITRFFGIFFLFFHSAKVLGNLILSTILSSGIVNTTHTEEELDTCGANFCPELDLVSKNSTSDDYVYSKIITMSCIYLSCSLLSVAIIAFLVDPLSKFGVDETFSLISVKKLLAATFDHMKNLNQILIIPLTIWSGFQQAFLEADFTRAFVTCGLGVHMIGYVLIANGVFDAVCSLTFSPVVKRFGRIPIFTFGAIVNVSLLLLLNMWRPNPDYLIVFFLVASLWGVSDAVWQTQINAFYGVIFPGKSEAAFNNYHLWKSFGFIMAYVMSGLICVDSKIYVQYVLLGFGMLGYYLIEFIAKRGANKPIDKTINTINEINL